LRTPGDPEAVTAEAPDAESGEADEANEAAEPDGENGAEGAPPDDRETDPVPEDIDDATRAAE
jgi:ParB family chromosome partitioning protein